MSRFIAPAGSALLVVLVVVLLVKADAGLFEEDAEFSTLYDKTLEDAFFRFSDSDKNVAAGGGQDAGQLASQPPAPAAGRPAIGGGVRPAGQIPGAGNRALGFGKGQPALPGARPGAAQAGGQHAHDDGGPHTRLGTQLLGQGQYDRAIAEFQLALQENPNRVLAKHYIGDSLRYLGRNGEAISVYQEVLRMKPSYHCCYVHMGDIMAAQGQQGQADIYFGQAIAGYQKDLAAGGPQASIAAYHLAKFYIDNGRDLEEALRLAKQAADAAPGQAVYLHLLARSYESLGRVPEAVQTMNQVLQLNPENVQVFQVYRDQLAAKAAAPGAQAPAPVTPPAVDKTPK